MSNTYDKMNTSTKSFQVPKSSYYTNHFPPLTTLINHSKNQWNVKKLSDLRAHEDHHLIQKIYLPTIPTKDSIYKLRLYSKWNVYNEIWLFSCTQFIP